MSLPGVGQQRSRGRGRGLTRLQRSPAGGGWAVPAIVTATPLLPRGSERDDATWGVPW